jgi:hypothetical protein
MPLPLPRPATLVARQPQPKVPLSHTAEGAAKKKHQ